MSTIPNPGLCLRLLREAGCSDDVINHCKAVRKVAVRIAKKAHANIQLVEAGALLHDIGRSKSQGIMHGVEGAKIATELGLPLSIVNIIERHLGAGIPLEEAATLGLPPKDYMPITLEEKIVAHADNLIDNDREHSIEKEVEKALQKGHTKHAERLMELHRELSQRCGMDLNDI
ncbi:MAG: HDIG domain-containing protein [Thermoplasmata archaeon]|nr:HDIG domain-containing protein [Thermoplasmata archaeon]MBE3141018.1 HDIG domain-containing protein [Thermoplasmata archaeon]